MSGLTAPRRYPNHVEPTEPIAGRRLGGAHWWDPDRLHHLEDLPRFCPGCGEALDGGISVEYWQSDQRVYHSWCRACGWSGDIIRVRRMVGYEAAEED